jgi:hypothetical protein
MADKLTAAQAVILDKVALHGTVTGVPVIKDGMPPYYASLRSCQALVTKGYLRPTSEESPHVFELDESEAEPVAASPEEYAVLVEKLGLDAATTQSRKLLLALNTKASKTGTKVFEGVPTHVKASRRRKGKVAKQSRKRNRAT